ncbi:YARHG domain-containing protein [bacterium]|nr:YARHG domain-containing protein [bacterium]
MKKNLMTIVFICMAGLIGCGDEELVSENEKLEERVKELEGQFASLEENRADINDEELPDSDNHVMTHLIELAYEGRERHYTYNDLNNLTQNELKLLRNAFFAFYNRPFKNEEYQNYYLEHLPGYKPDDNNWNPTLSDVEYANVNTIKELEKGNINGGEMSQFFILEDVNIVIDVPSYVTKVKVIGRALMLSFGTGNGGINIIKLTDEESQDYNKSSIITPESLLSSLRVSNSMNIGDNLTTQPIKIENTRNGRLKDGTPYAAIEYFTMGFLITAEIVLCSKGNFFRFIAVAGLNIDNESKGAEFLKRVYNILDSFYQR